MRKIYIGVIFLLGIQAFSGQDQKTLWQKDIESTTQDFLTDMTVTLDKQILLSGSSINTKSEQVSTENTNKNKGYDYHVIKLSQQGEILWDKFYGGSQYDFLMSTVTTEDGGGTWRNILFFIIG